MCANNPGLLKALIPNFKEKPEATITNILWLLSFYPLHTNMLAIRPIPLNKMREMTPKQLQGLMDRIYAQLSVKGADPANRFG